MKKILQLLPVLAAMLLASAGCNNKGASSSDPKEVLVAFFNEIKEKDWEGAGKLATKESQSMISMIEMGMKMAEKYEKNDGTPKTDPMEEFKNLEYGAARIEGDNAFVPVKNNKEKVELEFPLKKEGGAWKVDFTMATMQKMAQKMGKDEGMSQEDLDAIKNLDPETMKKGMEAADSLLKNMENIDPGKLKELQDQMKNYKDSM